MISVNAAVAIHKLLIREFGGSYGIRDNNLLESALARPFQTFDGVDLYPSAYLQAAAILENLLINHPFIDGNKRTAFVLMTVLLAEANITFHISQDELYEFIIHVINARPSIETISTWIEKKSSINE